MNNDIKKTKERSIIFAGIIRKEPNCGESMKNHIFIDRLKEIYSNVIIVELAGPKKHPWRFLNLLIKSFQHPLIPIIVSYSSTQAYRLFQLLNVFKRKNIYYWVIGGALHKKISSGNFKVEVFKPLKRIFVESAQMKQSLNNLGLFNVERVPNFKPINYIPSISNKNFQKPVKFVFLSRIHPDKGCNLIIEAVKDLNRAGFKQEFSVDFYGPFHKNYKDQFLKAIENTDNIAYKGFLNLREKSGYDILSSYHAMLFPTFWEGEGFPGVIIDAYIAGLPVIASNWNFNSEVVDQNKGIIIKSKNLEALIKAMEDIINSTNLKDISNNCQKEAEKYDVKNVISIENLGNYLK